MERTYIMKVEMKVDWLSLTGKAEWGVVGYHSAEYGAALAFASYVLDLVTEGDCVVRARKPAPHYEYGFEDIHSGLHMSISSRLNTQGWMLRASGSVLGDKRRADRLLFLAGQRGWGCSRLDFAIDLIGSEMKPADVWTAWKVAHQGNRQKSVSLLEGASGDTVYIGSRASEKMVRVYDKGAEQNVPFDWLRIEMEFKGDAATQAADAAQYGIKALVVPLARFMDIAGHPILDVVFAVASGEDFDGYWPLREKPPRERWFETDVLSALRKWAAEDTQAALDWLLNAHDQAVIAAEVARRREFEEPIL